MAIFAFFLPSHSRNTVIIRCERGISDDPFDICGKVGGRVVEDEDGQISFFYKLSWQIFFLQTSGHIFFYKPLGKYLFFRSRKN